MPAKEIKELRESGKLDEALSMAKSELEASPENIWAKRNLAWVYYAILKKEQGNQDAFLPIISKVLDLKLPDDEVMFYEQFCWVIGGHIFKMSKSMLSVTDKFNAVKLIFDRIKVVKIEQSKGFSFLLKSLHNAFKELPSDGQFNKDNFIDNSKSYRELVDWIGFNSFLKEDFEPHEVKGRKIMSFVEQFIIAYAKVLLEGERKKGSILRRINPERTDPFLTFLNEVIEKHPEYQYSLFYKSKLLLALERFEEAKETLLTFVKKKKNDFWVWDLLAVAYPEDIDVQIRCLCKALTLNTKESFLVNVHQKLATLLVQKKLFKEASVEALNTINIRKKNKWKINNELIKYTHENWFDKNQDLKSNKNFYHKQALLAEELLYNNHEEVIIAIDFVNSNKKMANFIKDKSMHGFFSYRHLKINPKIGDMYKARLNKKGDEGFFTVLTIKPANGAISECVTKISGQLRLHQNGDFGFINDNFVPPDIVKSNNLKDGVTLSGNAILSFNKKKKEWGWRVYKINQ
jgi:tetratricopeptide (TPR) repeat protein